MEFEGWREYLRWLQGANLPLFTKALALSRRESAVGRKRRWIAQSRSQDFGLDACDRSVQKLSALAQRAQEESSELQQVSAELDLLEAQCRRRTARLLSHKVYQYYERCLTEEKDLGETARALYKQRMWTTERALSAANEHFQCVQELASQRGRLEHEGTEADRQLDAERLRLAGLERERQQLDAAMRRTEEEWARATAEERRLQRQLQDLRTQEEAADLRSRSEELRLQEVSTLVDTMEARLSEVERASIDYARKNLKLIMDIESASEVSARKHDELSALVRALELQETSVEDLPFRSLRLRADYFRSAKKLARLFHAKTVLLQWRNSAADARALRIHRTECIDAEQQWTQDLKNALELKQKKAKAKRGKIRKKEGSRNKRLLDSITVDDLCSSFQKMEK